MLIFGLTGLASSGKGEASNYLKSKGFEKFVFSDILKIEAQKRGILTGNYEEQKNILSKLGDELRKETGKMEVLAIMLVGEIKKRNLDKVIVDGFRALEEAETFRNNFSNFKLIFVDTPEKIRFERRKLEDPTIKFEEFLERDKRDIEKKGLGKVIKTCNITIENTGSKEELYKKLDKIINQV
ncbi:MAG: AAA family ATPase [Nanoarchaeota archaeon]|nr:AAA family ATPase [Nanoarchaeota archaeon]